MAFGARVIKTGIAVALSLYISLLFHFSHPVIAAVAAIFAMQPTIYRSWRYFLEQLQTSVLGSLLAMAAGMFFSNEPIVIGLICILVIMICLKMKMEETVGLTLVTVVAVMDASGEWQYALTRFLLIIIGIGSAFIINILFFPPRPKVQFVAQNRDVFVKLSLLLRTMISDEIKENAFRDDKLELENALKSLSTKYTLLEEELKKLKRAGYRQVRQLVVYKQMLNAFHKGLTVLEIIEQHYFQASRTAETDEYFDKHLEKLVKYHEHVLLKFDDKLKPESSESVIMEEENRIFLKQMAERFSTGDDGLLRLAIVASALYDYGYQLGRFDKLVEQYNRGVEEDDERLKG